MPRFRLAIDLWNLVHWYDVNYVARSAMCNGDRPGDLRSVLAVCDDAFTHPTCMRCVSMAWAAR